MLTLVQNFYVPFMREFLLCHGICNCARRTCVNLLSKCAPPHPLPSLLPHVSSPPIRGGASTCCPRSHSPYSLLPHVFTT
jgi:hypothetical protein